jgi:hypothetical protein
MVSTVSLGKLASRGCQRAAVSAAIPGGARAAAARPCRRRDVGQGRWAGALGRVHRISRNPLELGMMLLQAGGADLFSGPSAAGRAAALAAAGSRGLVASGGLLGHRFGKTGQADRNHIRRWLNTLARWPDAGRACNRPCAPLTPTRSSRSDPHWIALAKVAVRRSFRPWCGLAEVP